MIKTLVGVILGIVLTGLIAVVSAKNLMFTITPSPFGVEETAARIRSNGAGGLYQQINRR